MRRQQAALKRAVEQRQIPYLVHFTNIKNIPSIVENGLASRRILDRNMISYSHSDELRLDKRLHTVSLSIAKPNAPMFAALKHRTETTDKDWVMIIIDPAILWELPCLFFKNNAACKGFSSSEDCYFQGEKAFEMMFSGERSRSLCSFMPTLPQAEVMVINHIPVKYFMAIDCCSQDVADYLKPKMGQYGDLLTINDVNLYESFMMPKNEVSFLGWNRV